MPEQGVKERKGRSTGPAAAGAIALLVEDGAPPEIERAMSALGLHVSAFAGVEGLLEDPEPDAFERLLIWAVDAGPALPRAIEVLKRSVEPAQIVVLCSSIKGWEVHCALAAGAKGIVLLDEIDRALGPCLSAVAAGQVCVPLSHWRQIEAPALSAREKQILGLVVMGYMNSQIAEQLFLAESTVKSHLSSAFAKLGVRSRHEAVNLILDPQRGLGMGILGLGGERIELSSAERSS